MPDENNTLKRIISAGAAEFLSKGFQRASLRNIVKDAGVTTGLSTATFPARRSCSTPSPPPSIISWRNTARCRTCSPAFRRNPSRATWE